MWTLILADNWNGGFTLYKIAEGLEFMLPNTVIIVPNTNSRYYDVEGNLKPAYINVQNYFFDNPVICDRGEEIDQYRRD